jgi:GNAT superfamily N-acetyltransferase
MREITARRATEEDLEFLTDLCRRSFPGTLLWDGPRFMARNWWRCVLRSSAAETWVFSSDGQPSAFCVVVRDMKGWQAEPLYPERSKMVRSLAAALRPRLVLTRLTAKRRTPTPPASECPRSAAVAATGGRIWVRLLAVAPEKRRQGIAVRMLRWCESRAVELGRNAIELFVFFEHTSARRLYAQQGFVCTEHRRNGCVFTKVLEPERPSPACAAAQA